MITLFSLQTSKPCCNNVVVSVVRMCMLCSVRGTSIITTNVPKITVERTVSRGSSSRTTPSMFNRGQTEVNSVGRTVKHPVTLPVTEKAANVLCAISSLPLTRIMLSNPAGLSLRLITPVVLCVVRALLPTVTLMLVRVSVGVLPVLLLYTVIR